MHGPSLPPRDSPVRWRKQQSADRLPGIAYVIDRVDLLGYLASGARLRDPSIGTLVVRPSEGGAYYLGETLSGGAGQPLTLAFWRPGYYLVFRIRRNTGQALNRFIASDQTDAAVDRRAVASMSSPRAAGGYM